jgi:hypothetical protein
VATGAEVPLLPIASEIVGFGSVAAAFIVGRRKK